MAGYSDTPLPKKLGIKAGSRLRLVDAVRPTLPDAGALWLAWPKRASKRPTDITEDRLRALLLPTGLVDNKVCAIDDVRSGLRFVLRVELRRP